MVKKSILTTNVAETGQTEHKASECSHTMQSPTHTQTHTAKYIKVPNGQTACKSQNNLTSDWKKKNQIV